MANTEMSRSARLNEIIKIMRKYKMISNFYHQTNPQDFRHGLEELGPTFIKAGQMMSTRPDLVSPTYIQELQRLQDHVPADSFAVIKRSVEHSLGQPMNKVFKAFDEKPFASASIGQTYHAQLMDGTAVVVKVQHPHVQELVKTDLALFDQAIKIINVVPFGKMVIDPRRVYQELSNSLLNEIDTNREIKNGVEFYRLNNNDDIIKVPKVYEKESAQGLLVNQAMNGTSIKHLIHKPLSDDQDKKKQQLAERHYIARVLVRNFIKQVFVDHYFHADPHPGNLLFYRLKPGDPDYDRQASDHQWSGQVKSFQLSAQQSHQLPPYRLVYLDFGMMGRLTSNLADGIADIVLALNSKDSHFIGEAILAVCNRTGQVDKNQFYEDLDSFMRPYFSAGLGEIDFSNFTFQIINLCEKNHLQMKSEVTLLIKAFGLLEATVAALDSSISMMDVARPFARQLIRRRFNWRNTIDQELVTLYRGLKASSTLPIKVNELIDSISTGQARIKFQYQHESKVLRAIERIVNRLMIVIILAAVILGSSILVEGSANHPNINRLGVVGYSVAIIVIIILVINEIISRWRRNHRH